MAGEETKTEQKETETTTQGGTPEESGSTGKALVVKTDSGALTQQQKELSTTLQEIEAAAASGEKPRVNAFTAVAMLVREMRISLEQSKREGQLPRWVRVVRVREYLGPGATNLIAREGVARMVGGFVMVVGYLAELALKAKEILIQVDGGRALLEVGAEMLKTATSDDFMYALRSTVEDNPPKGANPLKGVGPIVEQAMKVIDKIPDPEDVDQVCEEIYQLLVVEQLALPLKADGTVDGTKLKPEEQLHLDAALTGKVRMMAWALNKAIKFGGLKDNVRVCYLGSRRVWETEDAGQPQSAALIYKAADSAQTVYHFDYSGGQTQLVTAPQAQQDTGDSGGGGDSSADQDTTPQLGNDIEEANALLELYGYTNPDASPKTQFNAGFASRLRRFQVANELEITGRLDNATINQLMNLDYQRKSLRRAKTFALAAVDWKNFDDKKNPDQEKPA